MWLNCVALMISWIWIKGAFYTSWGPTKNMLLFLILQEGRTSLHYAAALQGTTGGVNQLYNVLVENGADENVVDVVRPVGSLLS